MIATSYISIAERLDQELNIQAVVDEHKALRFIALFNNQFTNEAREHAISKPAILIQYLDLLWKDQTNGIQQADAIIRVHIGYHSIADDQYAAFDRDEALKVDGYCDLVHTALQGFSATGLGAMSRIRTSMDESHDHVFVTMMDYACTIKDCSADPRVNLTPTTPGYEVRDEDYTVTPAPTPYVRIETH